MGATKQNLDLLIEQCKRNNAKAQMYVYDKYCQGMFTVALRYVKDSMQAEDLMQDAFIKAFQQLHTFRGEVSFGAWLKRIVINQCLDWLKKKKLDLISLDQINTIEVDDEEESRVFSDLELDVIVAGIKQMKEKYRLVLSLYLLEGYDHQEIAQILGITEVSSRTHLLRGKKLLATSLQQQIVKR